MSKHRPAKQPNRTETPPTAPVKYVSLGQLTSKNMKQKNRAKSMQHALRKASK